MRHHPAEAVLAAAAVFAGPAGRSPLATPLAGPWGHNGVYRVQTRAGAFVLKRWHGPERIRRGQAETRQLIRLWEAGFTAAPRPLRAGAGWFVDGGDGALWSAQEHIGTSPVPAPHGPAWIGGAVARQLGAVLAGLHATPCPAGGVPPGVSRLDELADLDAAAVPAEHRADVIVALRRVLAERDTLLGLPRARLHGDVNFDNLLPAGDRLVLIDWEFTRHDIRILDLAMLAAPKRAPDGSFLIADPEVYAQILRGYQQAAGTPLAPAELRLLPTAALAHYLLVLRDTLAAGSAYAAAAGALIGRLLRTAPLTQAAARSDSTAFISPSTRVSSIGLAASPSTLK